MGARAGGLAAGWTLLSRLPLRTVPPPTPACCRQGRCVKKYRLGSVGHITGIEVKYDAGLQKATVACTWSIDKILGL